MTAYLEVLMNDVLEAHKPRFELPRYFLLKHNVDGSALFILCQLAGGLKGILPGAVDRKPLDAVAHNFAIPLSAFQMTRVDYEHLAAMLVSLQKQRVSVLIVDGLIDIDPNANRPVFGVPIHRVIAEIASSQHEIGFDENSRIFVPADAYAIERVANIEKVAGLS